MVPAADPEPVFEPRGRLAVSPRSARRANDASADMTSRPLGWAGPVATAAATVGPSAAKDRPSYPQPLAGMLRELFASSLSATSCPLSAVAVRARSRQLNACGGAEAPAASPENG